MAAHLAAAPVHGQEVDVWLDATASHARPPADVVADPATYGVLGGRLDLGFDWGETSAVGRLGSSLSGAEGQWLQGELSLSAGGRVGPAAARAEVGGFGLHYLDPYDYTAAGAELRSSVAVPRGAAVLSILPVLSAGRWTSSDVEGDLLVAGGDVELARPLGPFEGSVSAGAVHVANGVTTGPFVRGQGELAHRGGRWAGAIRVTAQKTPIESELGGGVLVSVSLGPSVELGVYAGRTLRDALYGAEGTFVVSTGLSVRPLHLEPSVPAAVADVGARREAGRVVRFAIRAPEARRVEITGDFTGWEPVAMTRADDSWTVERVLPPGVHHFGFLVDGSWSIPPDSPGVVDDGWGRKNASVVIEP